MTKISIFDSNLSIIKKDTLTTGSGSSFKVHFTFNEGTWGDYTERYAVFYQVITQPKLEIQILEDNTVEIPNRLLSADLPLFIGVYGTKADGTLLCTNFKSVPVMSGAFSGCIESYENQLSTLVRSLDTKIKFIRVNDNGEFQYTTDGENWTSITATDTDGDKIFTGNITFDKPVTFNSQYVYYKTANGNNSLILPDGVQNETIATREWVTENADEAITVDDSLSVESTNPVQNKIITAELNKKSTFSGNYNDLTNKPAIPTVPTNVSAFTNDAGYLTEHQDISKKADLVDGKVPSSQLPSYVDDVVEYASFSSLPKTGEAGKIYVTIDTNKIYRWSGSAYIEIVDVPDLTNYYNKGEVDELVEEAQSKSIASATAGTSTEADGYTVTPITFTLSDETTLAVDIKAKNGATGATGADGVGVEKAEINANGELVITYTNGNSSVLGKVVGADGADGADGTNGTDGADGVSVTGATAGTSTEENGYTVTPITFTLSNGLSVAVSIKAKNGTNGTNGADGADGADGQDGVSVVGVTEGTATEINGYTVTPLTFTFSDNTTKKVSVKAKNGVDGAGGEDIEIIELSVTESGDSATFSASFTQFEKFKNKTANLRLKFSVLDAGDYVDFVCTQYYQTGTTQGLIFSSAAGVFDEANTNSHVFIAKLAGNPSYGVTPSGIVKKYNLEEIGSGLPELPRAELIKVGDDLTNKTVYFDTSRNLDEWLAGLTYDENGEAEVFSVEGYDYAVFIGIDIGLVSGASSTAGQMGYALSFGLDDFFYITSDASEEILERFAITNKGWRYENFTLSPISGDVETYVVSSVVSGCDFIYSSPFNKPVSLIGNPLDGTIKWAEQLEIIYVTPNKENKFSVPTDDFIKLKNRTARLRILHNGYTDFICTGFAEFGDADYLGFVSVDFSSVAEGAENVIVKYATIVESGRGNPSGIIHESIDLSSESGGGGSDITVDTALSTTSTNPVQNKIITQELNKKSEFSGSYNDLTNKPTLSTVATSGNYHDLTNKPTIPTVPTNVSAFTNDAGYLTATNIVSKADLVDGKVPSSQLPSYVDDVLEYGGYGLLPATGEAGKIYVTTDTNKIYRWSGSAYIEIVDVPDLTNYYNKEEVDELVAEAGGISIDETLPQKILLKVGDTLNVGDRIYFDITKDIDEELATIYENSDVADKDTAGVPILDSGYISLKVLKVAGGYTLLQGSTNNVDYGMIYVSKDVSFNNGVGLTYLAMFGDDRHGWRFASIRTNTAITVNDYVENSFICSHFKTAQGMIAIFDKDKYANQPIVSPEIYVSDVPPSVLYFDTSTKPGLVLSNLILYDGIRAIYNISTWDGTEEDAKLTPVLSTSKGEYNGTVFYTIHTGNNSFTGKIIWVSDNAPTEVFEMLKITHTGWQVDHLSMSEIGIDSETLKQTTVASVLGTVIKAFPVSKKTEVLGKTQGGNLVWLEQEGGGSAEIVEYTVESLPAELMATAEEWEKLKTGTAILRVNLNGEYIDFSFANYQVITMDFYGEVELITFNGNLIRGDIINAEISEDKILYAAVGYIDSMGAGIVLIREGADLISNVPPALPSAEYIKVGDTLNTKDKVYFDTSLNLDEFLNTLDASVARVFLYSLVEESGMSFAIAMKAGTGEDGNPIWVIGNLFAEMTRTANELIVYITNNATDEVLTQYGERYGVTLKRGWNLDRISLIPEHLLTFTISSVPATGFASLSPKKILTGNPTTGEISWQDMPESGGGGSDITVDTALSTTSTNPVQNKVVTAALNEKVSTTGAQTIAGSKTFTSTVALQGGANVPSDSFLLWGDWIYLKSSTTGMTGYKYLTLPQETGTLATQEWVNENAGSEIDTSTLVDLSSAQTITGKKTFTEIVADSATIGANLDITGMALVNGTFRLQNGGEITVSNSGGGATYTFTDTNGGEVATQEWFNTMLSGMFSATNTWSGMNVYTSSPRFQADVNVSDGKGFIWGDKLKLTGSTSGMMESKTLTLPQSSGTLATQEWVEENTASIDTQTVEYLSSSNIMSVLTSSMMSVDTIPSGYTKKYSLPLYMFGDFTTFFDDSVNTIVELKAYMRVGNYDKGRPIASCKFSGLKNQYTLGTAKSETASNTDYFYPAMFVVNGIDQEIIICFDEKATSKVNWSTTEVDGSGQITSTHTISFVLNKYKVS